MVHGRRCNPRAPKPLKIQVFKGSPSPQGSHSTYILWDTTRPRHITQTYNTCPSLIEIGSKTAEKNSAQTNKPTDTTKIMVTWPWSKNAAKTTSHFCRIGTQWVNAKNHARVPTRGLLVQDQSIPVLSPNAICAANENKKPSNCWQDSAPLFSGGT